MLSFYNLWQNLCLNKHTYNVWYFEGGSVIDYERNVGKIILLIYRQENSVNVFESK